MKNLLKCLLLSTPLISHISKANDEIAPPFFTGSITEESVDKFIAENNERTNFTSIDIASQGGDVRAALKLGRWVRDKHLDIRVRTMCYSACANYVFIAAKNKLVTRGSFVGWHGDMEQKDFRDLIEKYELALSEKKWMTEEDSLFISDNKKKYMLLKELRLEQADFYSSVGVDSYFGRIGQEPIKYPSDGWTLTANAMKYLGIKNVIVPEGYATEAYFAKDPMASLVNHGPILILDISSSGEVFPVNPTKFIGIESQKNQAKNIL